MHSGHRQRLGQRFLTGGPAALPDYERLELVLFRAFARKDTKDLSKRLIARFGSFAEVTNAPAERPKKDKDVGEAVVVSGSRLCACGAGLRAPRGVQDTIPRQEKPIDRR